MRDIGKECSSCVLCVICHAVEEDAGCIGAVDEGVGEGNNAQKVAQQSAARRLPSSEPTIFTPASYRIRIFP